MWRLTDQQMLLRKWDWRDRKRDFLPRLGVPLRSNGTEVAMPWLTRSTDSVAVLTLGNAPIVTLDKPHKFLKFGRVKV